MTPTLFLTVLLGIGVLCVAVQLVASESAWSRRIEALAGGGMVIGLWLFIAMIQSLFVEDVLGGNLALGWSESGALPAHPLLTNAFTGQWGQQWPSMLFIVGSLVVSAFVLARHPRPSAMLGTIVTLSLLYLAGLLLMLGAAHPLGAWLQHLSDGRSVARDLQLIGLGSYSLLFAAYLAALSRAARITERQPPFVLHGTPNQAPLAE